MSHADYLAGLRSRATRTKVTLSFSQADAMLLPKLLAREDERQKAEFKKDHGFAPSWRQVNSLSAALYGIVMREARTPASSGRPTSRRASPGARSSTRLKRKGAPRRA